MEEMEDGVGVGFDGRLDGRLERKVVEEEEEGEEDKVQEEQKEGMDGALGEVGFGKDVSEQVGDFAKEGVGGGGGGGKDGNDADEKKSSESPLWARARRIRALQDRKRMAVDISEKESSDESSNEAEDGAEDGAEDEEEDEAEDEDTEGSSASISRRFRRKSVDSAVSGKSAKFIFSTGTAKPALLQPQRRHSTSSSPDFVHAVHDAEGGGEGDASTDSEPDHDASDSDPDSDDVKSNVSSKTSFSKRSVKSTNSTTSPSVRLSSPPIKYPQLPLPSPTPPPEQISDLGSDSPIIIKNCDCASSRRLLSWEEEETEHEQHEHDAVEVQERRERYIWNWKEDELRWMKENENENENETEQQQQVVSGKRSSRKKKFVRGKWRGHPLFAAVTAVEVGREDVRDLLSVYNYGGGEGNMKKRFFNEEFPFIAYVRTTGSQDQDREKDLLPIIRQQILDVTSSLLYDPNTRKKKIIAAAEGYLPLEARFGGGFSLTQNDLQRQFSLPSWREREKGLEVLGGDGGGVVTAEVRRRKREEERERERKMEEDREFEEVLVRWRARMKREKEKEKEVGEQGENEEKGEGEQGEDEEKGKGQEGQEEKEKEDEPKNQVKPSQESDITANNITSTSPSPPIPSTTPDPTLSSSPIPNSNPNPDANADHDLNLTPSTPTAYFSRRRSCLHNFWTKEAQPADFESAKAVRRNTFLKWRGDGEPNNKRPKGDVTKGTATANNIAEWVASQRRSGLGQERGQGEGEGGTSGTATGSSGRLPVPVPKAAPASVPKERTPRKKKKKKKKKLTRQQQAEFDYTERGKEKKGEEGKEHQWALLADELMEVLIHASDYDASDDGDDDDDVVVDDHVEDILGLLGEGDGVRSNKRLQEMDEDEDMDKDKGEDEDSYPLVDLVRESMMNTF